MAEKKQRPSIIWGVRTAARMWALVVVVWLVGMAFFVPASVVLQRAAVEAFGHVPEGFDLPVGDGAILMMGLLRDVADTLLVGLVLAVVLSWSWTVLWHAGVARVSVWDPESSSGVSRILGLGLGAWWRYCRLSLVALVALLALLAAIWFPLTLGIKTAFEAMAEDRMVLLIGIGVVLSPMAKFLVWGATLRGAWELARPDARSPVMAWLRGLIGVFRQPFSTFGTLLVLGIGQALFALVPLVAPIYVPALRGTPVGSGVAAAATLAASFLLVALFAAFAPISGVVFRSGDDDEA
ncbi:MAG: hypothetical protein DRJ61_00750 [Acidobacteria bacterium]|nr:MAG: hypothetical protein DRJ61_00750 [Acidobacteriota bacterium]